jgi:hypothetical protein
MAPLARVAGGGQYVLRYSKGGKKSQSRSEKYEEQKSPDSHFVSPFRENSGEIT